MGYQDDLAVFLKGNSFVVSPNRGHYGHSRISTWRRERCWRDPKTDVCSVLSPAGNEKLGSLIFLITPLFTLLDNLPQRKWKISDLRGYRKSVYFEHSFSTLASATLGLPRLPWGLVRRRKSYQRILLITRLLKGWGLGVKLKSRSLTWNGVPDAANNGPTSSRSNVDFIIYSSGHLKNNFFQGWTMLLPGLLILLLLFRLLQSRLDACYGL